MTWSNFIINLIFAYLLLFINGKLGKWKERTSSLFGYSVFGFNDITEENFSDNFFQSIIHPAIYVAIISALLQMFTIESIVTKLCLVVPLYWFLRLMIAVLRDTACFLNWRFQIISFFVSLLLGEGTLYWIVAPLLKQGKDIFIDLEQFRDSFWFAVFCVIAKFVWDYSKREMIGDEIFPSEKNPL